MDSQPFSHTQISAFARMAALAARVKETDVVFHSHTLALGTLTARDDTSLAYAAALLGEGALGALSDGDTLDVRVKGLTREPQDGRVTVAGDWRLSVVRLHSFDLPSPGSVPMPTAQDALRPFLSEAINEVPGLVLSGQESLSAGFTARFPHHTPFTMAAQLCAFALIDAGAGSGPDDGRFEPPTMDFLVAKAGASTGSVLRVTVERTA